MQRRRIQPLPPLPGTGIPPRGLFVSRFGAILERPGTGVPRHVDEARFQPRVLELLFRAGQAGWNVYVIGNEDDVARGRVSDAAWEKFDTALLSHLKGQGIALKRNYVCLDHPQGKPPHDKDSVFLFPNTGCLYHAAQEDGIELRESWLVSGDVMELAAAWRAGVRVAAIRGEAAAILGVEDLQVEPDVVARSAASALAEVLATAGAGSPRL
jgi:D-glycero-D-manno-heptose 1,7-bisphosphate phosphatase